MWSLNKAVSVEEEKAKAAEEAKRKEDAEKAIKALEEAKKVGRTVATVTGDTLRIRKEPAADAAVYDLAARGEIFRIVDAGELEFSDGIRLNADLGGRGLRRPHRLCVGRLYYCGIRTGRG